MLSHLNKRVSHSIMTITIVGEHLPCTEDKPAFESNNLHKLGSDSADDNNSTFLMVLVVTILFVIETMGSIGIPKLDQQG